MRTARAQRDNGKPAAADVTAALRRRASLRLCFRNGRAQWALSTGTQVPEGVAKAVVKHPDILGTDVGRRCASSNLPPTAVRLRPLNAEAAAAGLRPAASSSAPR